MPYTTPPTFTTGNVLSAANLNNLSDNIEFLYGVTRQTNPATQMVEIIAGDGATATAAKWAIRHKTDTLKFHMTMTNGTIDAMRIKYGSTTVYTDSNDRSNPYVYTGTTDISGLGLTVGTWYVVTVEIDGEPASANNTLRVLDLREIP